MIFWTSWGCLRPKYSPRRFLKYILHLPLSAPNMAVRGELYRTTATTSMVDRTWNSGTDSALKMPQSYWKQQCIALLTWLMLGKGAGHITWFPYLTMPVPSLTGIYEMQSCAHTETNSSKNGNSNLMREYSLSGEGGNKLRTYRTFKKNFLLESYLVNVTRTSFRNHTTANRLPLPRNWSWKIPQT